MTKQITINEKDYEFLIELLELSSGLDVFDWETRIKIRRLRRAVQDLPDESWTIDGVQFQPGDQLEVRRGSENWEPSVHIRTVDFLAVAVNYVKKGSHRITRNGEVILAA